MTPALSRRATTVACVASLLVAAACSSDRAPATTSQPEETAAAPESMSEPRRSAWFEAACSQPLEHLRRITRGFYPGRSPDLMYVPDPDNYFNGFAHSGPWKHVQEVPLVLYGPGFVEPRGSLDAGREVTIADLAPTYAELLGYDLPRAVDGNVLDEALVPAPARVEPPRLIVTMVWDGVGTNVLERWPGAWPELERLAGAGSAYEGATVGSSPSVTPPVHATLGTGVFPNRHGIVDIPQRTGARVEDSWEASSPKNLEWPTLADVYDAHMGNDPLVGMVAERAWQLGMIGHGAARPGGDRDIAVLTYSDSFGELFTNESHYDLPAGLEDSGEFERAIRDVDAEDGRLDDAWMGHELLDDPEQLPWTPVWTLYQSGIIEQLLRDEGFGRDEVPDLFYANYKQTDHVGHRWTMTEAEMRDAIAHQDRALGDLVDLLDRRVGRGRYVLVITADHGAQPPPEITEGWMIDQDPLTVGLERELGAVDGELVIEDRPVGLWLRPPARKAGVAERMAGILTGYTVEDDLTAGEEVPGYIETDARLFDAAFPMPRLPEIWRCARGRAKG